MAYNFVDCLRNRWSFSMIDTDLRDSKEIVNTLSVPESTKTFVFAIRVPEHDSTIHILSAQSLSTRSVIDAECLIRELCPDAVVAQVNGPAFGEESQEIDDGSNEIRKCCRELGFEGNLWDKFQWTCIGCQEGG